MRVIYMWTAVVLGASLSLAGCQSLQSEVSTPVDNAVIQTSVSQATPSTTSTEVPPSTTESTGIPGPVPAVEEPAVSRESSDSPCLITDTFSVGNRDFLVVDYVQVSWGPGGTQGALVPTITNSNRKLRTFEIPQTATLKWIPTRLKEQGWTTDPQDLYFYQLEELMAEGKVNSATTWGFWDIEVFNGYIVRLAEHL